MRKAGPPPPDLDAHGLCVGLVGSRWNAPMSDQLVDGAMACLRERGVADGAVEIVRVPGAWELSLAARALARTGRLDALVCVGVIIRGATPHFDVLAAEVTRSLSTLSAETGLPVGFGLITADTVEQALERSGPDEHNKGREAALAALEMAVLLRRLGS